MLSIKNQFIMAPVKLGYATGDGKINDRHLNFYRKRSKYLGAMTPEPLYMDKGLRELPTQLGIDDDDKIEGLKLFTDLLHQTDTKAIAHLNHPGRMANPKIPGNYWLSSTDKPCENGGATPKKMEGEDFRQVIDMFAAAAVRAEKAGFDFVELQFGHGYLVAQFLSPAVNDRTDEYGGSFENRTRLAMEIFDAVKQAINIPIIVRISGDEIIPKGFHVDEMTKFAELLEQKGAAALHITAGTACQTPPWFFQHMFIPKGKTWELAGKIKERVNNIPVIFVGRIHNQDDVTTLKEKYGAEYFALGRALVADETVVGKITGEIKENIRPCLACSEGCLGGVKSGQGLHCVVNPTVGTELEKIITRTTKKVAVVGGGLAGMEAAIILKERGAEVEIFEKDALGGQFNLAYLPPHKESLKELVDYYKKEISEKQIPVTYRETTAEDILAGKYDSVIVATGSVPSVPPIEGLKTYYWTEFLNDAQLPENEKILIVGGGLIAIEVSAKLISKNNEVIIVEMLPDVANGMEMIERVMTLKELKENGVVIYTSSVVEKIDGETVTVKSEKERFTLKGIQRIVMATGMRSLNPLATELGGKLPVMVIGDAKKTGKAQTAIMDGFVAGLSVE